MDIVRVGLKWSAIVLVCIVRCSLTGCIWIYLRELHRSSRSSTCCISIRRGSLTAEWYHFWCPSFICTWFISRAQTCCWVVLTGWDLRTDMVCHVLKSNVESAVRTPDCGRLTSISRRYCHHREIWSNSLLLAVLAMLYIETGGFVCGLTALPNLNSFL
jgi:hypothetical protein